MKLVIIAPKRSQMKAQAGEASKERLKLRHDQMEVMDASHNRREAPLDQQDLLAPSRNAFEPSCMHSNLHPSLFGLKVRTTASPRSHLFEPSAYLPKGYGTIHNTR